MMMMMVMMMMMMVMMGACRMLQGKPWSQMQDEAMATCAATGAKLLMDVESVSAKLGADNTTQDWRDFRAVIRVIKNHPCTLGYCATADPTMPYYANASSSRYSCLSPLLPVCRSLRRLLRPRR